MGVDTSPNSRIRCIALQRRFSVDVLRKAIVTFTMKCHYTAMPKRPKLEPVFADRRPIVKKPFKILT